ncbi:hypothetical protein ASG29_03630 [Sphingomonas sp. Leaf412]|uniref:PilZ domain-containing protein n=1 Tax=Sphingomonas sp. Leaf412 TaxID=1736370 RepID=UPI0006FA9575|nr:PilZ domain-containing protein [Sphingomonas sp. Leaf412]KQT35213.1 hypothetical protein ASG29_03630 [Sphingomonas sp. Leaf412]
MFRIASLTVGAVSERCHILNLSTAGAMIDCVGDLGAATNVCLRSDQLDQAAVVCWRIGSRVGLRFSRPLTPSDVRRCF